MKILFHENELNYRGTSIALYDYADFNERYLGNESIIIYNKTLPTNHHEGIKKFENRFKVIAYENPIEIQKHLKENQIDLFYMIKNGEVDGIDTDYCKTAVHAVFKHYEPHGDTYAYVSNWLAKEMTDNNSPYVPHMVNFENKVEDDLRKELQIPKQAKVYGYYGGAQSFNIDWVQKEIFKIAHQYKEVYFLFMGVEPFNRKKWWWSSLKNIIFLPPSSNIERKQKFINTTNALLHARERGETFGITVAEFAVMGKPVIAYANVPEKAHIQQLGSEGYFYKDKIELRNYILNTDLNKNPAQNYKEILPESVMDKFKEVFIIN